MGDGIFAAFDGPTRAVHCARIIGEAARALGVEVRSGLHTGEVERRQHEFAGIAVHIASRVQTLAQPGEILVTNTVRDLVVGSGVQFFDRGEHQLRHVPDPWRIFAVAP